MRGAWLLPLLLSGCVVSSYDPPGTPPRVPLLEEREESKGPVERPGPVQIGASHVLVAYRGANRAASTVDRTKEEARSFAKQLLERAIKGESFADLAKEYSDDRGSAAQGGSLGMFKREQMVPTFSEAAFALEVNQLSNVIESPFGFHVILRTE